MTEYEKARDEAALSMVMDLCDEPGFVLLAKNGATELAIGKRMSDWSRDYHLAIIKELVGELEAIERVLFSDIYNGLEDERKIAVKSYVNIALTSARKKLGAVE